MGGRGLTRWSVSNGVISRDGEFFVDLRVVHLLEPSFEQYSGTSYLRIEFHTDDGETLVITSSRRIWSAPSATGADRTFYDLVLVHYGDVRPDGVVDLAGSRQTKVMRWFAIGLAVTFAVSFAVLGLAKPELLGIEWWGLVGFALVPMLVVVLLYGGSTNERVRASAHSEFLRREGRDGQHLR